MKDNFKKKLSNDLNLLVFALALALVVFISIDTFMQKPFLTNPVYMRFQLWVCVVFMVEFFVQVYLADNHWRYFCRNIGFLLVSIPYLNIITQFHLQLDEQQLYFIRFVPLLRAACFICARFPIRCSTPSSIRRRRISWPRPVRQAL